MPLISRQSLVMYSPAEMYALVNDINAYPDFLPWCKSSHIISQTEDVIEASVEIAKGSLNKSFATRNLLQKNKMIEMSLLDGPFKHLEGFWRFKPLKDPAACKVTLDLEFEFNSKLIAIAVGPVFSKIANTLVDSFSKRAVEVYGER
ncbi:MAG: type II toxin-antitoxin system RatA family toxin [Gammaproteobacteria bacterium]|nr:type II toxin-antitoxin system RatA family toxin [Gammaproteobacteria bacterium]